MKTRLLLLPAPKAMFHKGNRGARLATLINSAANNMLVS